MLVFRKCCVSTKQSLMKPDDIDWRGLGVFPPNFETHSENKINQVFFVLEFGHTLVWQWPGKSF